MTSLLKKLLKVGKVFIKLFQKLGIHIYAILMIELIDNSFEDLPRTAW